MDSNVVMEILSRCSMKTVDLTKLVSKEWNNLTYESTFINLHSRRTKTVSGYFIQGLRNAEYYSDFVSMDVDDDVLKKFSLDYFPGEKVRILATSNMGILCFLRCRYGKDRFYICKPATRQFRALPNPKLRYMTAKVALVVLSSNPLRYKIIRLSEPRRGLLNYNNYYCEVFHSDTCTWKRKEDILLPIGVFLDFNSPISACGIVYWRTSDNSVLAFDEIHESYQIFPLPKPSCEEEYCTYKKLTKYEGKLAYICNISEDRYEIWVHKKMAWEKKFVMDTEEIKKEESFCLPKAFPSADIAFVNAGFSTMFYKFPHKIIQKDSITPFSKEDFAFRSDFELVDFGGKISKVEVSILGFLRNLFVGFLD